MVETIKVLTSGASSSFTGVVVLEIFMVIGLVAVVTKVRLEQKASKTCTPMIVLSYFDYLHDMRCW